MIFGVYRRSEWGILNDKSVESEPISHLDVVWTLLM